MSAEAIIPLKTKLPATLETVTLERYVLDVNGNAVKRRARLPFITDEIEPELVLRVIAEFQLIQAESRLALATGPLRFEYFPQLLYGRLVYAFDNGVSLWVSRSDGLANDIIFVSHQRDDFPHELSSSI